MHRPGILPLPLALALALAGAPWAQEQTEPGPVKVDAFHPDRETPAEPAYGGRVIIHLSSMPQHLQYTTENSAVVTYLYDCIHDKLAYQNWETWEMEPRLATGWDTEDTLVLKPEAAGKYPSVSVGEGEKARPIVYGSVSDQGDAYLVRAVSPENPAGEETRVEKADVVSLEQGTVFTFHLRDGVVWHDDHPFDADDVKFSWEVFQNPEVDCGEKRTYFTQILGCEVLDRLTVRFFYEEQYFEAEQNVCEIPLLARHVYDLLDPDCPQHDPDATLAERGEHVNENPSNNMWIGLGPYKVTVYDPSQYVEAEHFDAYYDAESPLYGGYFDTIRWRYVKDDNAAFNALLNGELDYFDRVKSEDYFGEATKQEVFTSNYFKGYSYTGQWGYTGWNLRRPQLKDKAVRHALAHAFDLENWRKTKYKGLAKLVTGPQSYFSPGYDHDVEPLAYDPGLAEELLAEAGWYDRDGDGIVDKDGIALDIEFLYPSGNEASRSFGVAYQEALADIGVKLRLRNLEWATYLERILARDFDAMNMAWVPPLESDPEQVWHSKNAGEKTSNHYGLADPRVDELIDRGRRELDKEKRFAIWRELHALIYDIQPCLFMINPPKKFAMNRKIRGLQCFMISPGYDPRRWYFPAGTPGTRTTRFEQ